MSNICKHTLRMVVFLITLLNVGCNETVTYGEYDILVIGMPVKTVLDALQTSERRIEVVAANLVKFEEFTDEFNSFSDAVGMQVQCKNGLSVSMEFDNEIISFLTMSRKFKQIAGEDKIYKGQQVDKAFVKIAKLRKKLEGNFCQISRWVRPVSSSDVNKLDKKLSARILNMEYWEVYNLNDSNHELTKLYFENGKLKKIETNWSPIELL